MPFTPVHASADLFMGRKKAGDQNVTCPFFSIIMRICRQQWLLFIRRL
jgi:hypothetical protein